jgi:DNA-binding NarL/FixJ family response regulator
MKVDTNDTVSPDTLAGPPVIAGTRVPVRTLFEYLERDKSLTDFLDQFPMVSHDQAVAVLRLAKNLVSVEQDKRDRTPADRDSRLALLSERELQVLNLIDEGLTNAQIGKRLGISVRTAEVHSRNILKKLGVRNRTSAIRLLRR